jgi:hypothetical protein
MVHLIAFIKDVAIHPPGGRSQSTRRKFWCT